MAITRSRSKRSAAAAAPVARQRNRVKKARELKRYVWKNAAGKRGAGIKEFLTAARGRGIKDISKFNRFRERGHVDDGPRQNANLFVKKITYKKSPSVKTKQCKYGKLASGDSYVCIKNPNHKSQGIMGFRPRARTRN
jgi:hypothetical protein